jgi:hypothetical protein
VPRTRGLLGGWIPIGYQFRWRPVRVAVPDPSKTRAFVCRWQVAHWTCEPRTLIGGERPDETWVGIALASSSVVLMPLLGIAKQRIADQIGSAATKGEGRQNMLCAYLAGALLVGLVGNMVVGAWWLDPGVGLLIAAVAAKEGLEAWRGEGCCVSSPLDGAGFEDDACTDDCCAH